MTETMHPSAEWSRYEAVLEFLKTTPAEWDLGQLPPSCRSVEETHGAAVLLGSNIALKLKKPVQFDFMDYSNPQKRLQLLEKELRINRKISPALYSHLTPIHRSSNGRFSLDGDGDIVDHVLVMSRFDPEDRLDLYSKKNGFSAELQDRLTDEIVTFHQNAAPITTPTDLPDFHKVIDQNFQQLDQFCPELFDLEAIRTYRSELHQSYEQLTGIEQDRLANGFIRFGHGDMHLQNMCLLHGQPTLFDAIEYEDDFAIGDTLYDLSFLLMDLNTKGFAKEANQILNRYLRKSGYFNDPDSLGCLTLLPFFLSMRAGIRTHVAANRYNQSQAAVQKDHFKATAQQLFQQSQRYLHRQAPSALAIGGYSGSGKSTTAAHLAPRLGNGVGAIRIRSDEIRRLLVTWDDYSPMPQSAYTPQISEAVYARMISLALGALKAGQPVIVDAVLDRQQDRAAFETAITSAGFPFSGLWLDVDETVMSQRISGRSRDASDATVDILRQQMDRQPEIQTDWIRINANGSTPEICNVIMSQL